MSVAMLELIDLYRSHQVTLAPEEAKVLVACEAKARRNYSIGFLVTSCGLAALLAGKSKLSFFSSFCLSGGAGVIFGAWSTHRLLDPWVDHILSMDGTQVQRELAKIIVNKYWNDPSTMQRLYRRFFSESVYTDTTPDKPILRWRFRSYYADDGAHSQGTNDNDSQGYAHVSSHGDSDGKKARIRSNKVSTNVVADATEDPIDSIFGSSSTGAEINQPVGSTSTARAHNRGHRRSHWRRRRMHHEPPVMKHA